LLAGFLGRSRGIYKPWYCWSREVFGLANLRPDATPPFHCWLQLGGHARAAHHLYGDCVVPHDNPATGVLAGLCVMRLVIADCTVSYAGRLSAHLPRAVRLLMVKADGSVSIHADGRAYKPLNWMSPPCTLVESAPTETDEPAEAELIWTVTNKAGETLAITLHEVHHDSSHELGDDPGLQKDGVEAHLQVLLAEHVHTFGDGWSLIRREFPTAIGPVDLLCRDGSGLTVAVEIKRRGEIDGVEQLTRYLELLNRDPVLAPVSGVFAAQEIKPQARTLAEDRGIRCVVVDYDALRGIDDSADKLF
jgi:hypothetical protein